MEYLIAIGLTLLFFWSIINLSSKQHKKQLNNVSFRQSTVHSLTMDYTINSPKKKLLSQADKHMSENMVKIVISDGKAYWVMNNAFYVAEINGSEVIGESAKQIDTSEMSKEDVDKLLEILDNLNNGWEDDNSSSRNSGF